MSKFQGFEEPTQNWSKLPHQLIDVLPQIETIGEMKVILYTLRHTWGYRDDYKKITIDEFENGRKRKNGSRIDNGTGLSKPTVVDGIKRAVSHGFLFERIDTSDSARVKKFYSLTGEGLKDLTPDVKRFNTGGKEVLHRSEKETTEKETTDINGFAKNPQTPSSGNNGPQDFSSEKKATLNKLAPIINEQANGDIITKEALRGATLVGYEVAQICKLDVAMASPANLKALARVTIALNTKKIIQDDLKSFSIWWYDYSWQGKKGQAPTPGQLGDMWGQFEASQQMTKSSNSNGPTLTPEQKAQLDYFIAQDAQK